MANTFKFGNENWAVKDGKVLAYNDENNAFKPLPFTFARSSSATRVDNEGLIKTTDSGFARIDFLNNTSGHLLLEPSSTNLIEYSNFESGWSTLSGGSKVLNAAISPEGTQNATVLSGDGVNSNAIYDSISVSVASYIFSVFAKKNNKSIITLQGFTSGAAGSSKFNLSDGTIDTPSSSGQFSDEKIEAYGNGWYRCSVKVTATSSGSKLFGFLGDSSDSGTLYSLYGSQLELGSFITSYIPTTGSTVTRTAETCDSAGNSTVFGDSEGVLYAEIAKNNGTQYSLVSLQKPSITNTYAYIGFLNNTTQIKAEVKVAGTAAFSKTRTFSDTSQYFKIALKYKSGDYALYINGHKTDTGTSTTIFSDGDLQELEFGNHNNSTFRYYGKIKNVQVYNTALTDAELIELTS